MSPSSNMIQMVLLQLVGVAPILLAYLVGMILALTFWRRYPTPSLLTCVASALFLVLSVAQTFLTQYLLEAARPELGWNNQQRSQMFTIIMVVGGVLRAAAFGLLLAAVFTGRRGTQQGWPTPLPQQGAPGPQLAGDQGITSRPGA
jgi:hypothetical protein